MPWGIRGWDGGQAPASKGNNAISTNVFETDATLNILRLVCQTHTPGYSVAGPPCEFFGHWEALHGAPTPGAKVVQQDGLRLYKVTPTPPAVGGVAVHELAPTTITGGAVAIDEHTPPTPA